LSSPAALQALPASMPRPVGTTAPFPGVNARGVPFEAEAVCEDSTDFGLVIPEGKLARFVSATDSEVSVAIGMLPTQAAL
jgi:hypothetical protein